MIETGAREGEKACRKKYIEREEAEIIRRDIMEQGSYGCPRTVGQLP
jgi:hypothetical protein